MKKLSPLFLLALITMALPSDAADKPSIQSNNVLCELLGIGCSVVVITSDSDGDGSGK